MGLDNELEGKIVQFVYNHNESNLIVPLEDNSAPYTQPVDLDFYYRDKNKPIFEKYDGFIMIGEFIGKSRILW